MIWYALARFALISLDHNHNLVMWFTLYLLAGHRETNMDLITELRPDKIDDTWYNHRTKDGTKHAYLGFWELRRIGNSREDLQGSLRRQQQGKQGKLGYARRHGRIFASIEILSSFN